MTLVVFVLLTLILLSISLILSSQNLVVCVLLMAFSFICGFLLIPYLHSEYLLVILVIVYLGAIVVFFLICVMLLDVSETDLLVPSTLGCSLFFFLILFYMICSSSLFSFMDSSFVSVLYPLTDSYLLLTNVEKIGLCLFSEFGFLLVICGFLMFVVIVGCCLILNVRNK